MSAAAGGPVAVHQFIATLNPHDATGTPTLCAARRAAGGRAGARRSSPRRSTTTWPSEAFKHWMYPEHAAPGDVAIYQFTTSSAVAGYLAEHGLPLILDFHNFTGPEYFAGWEPQSVAAGDARRPTSWPCWPPGPARPGQEQLQRRRSCGGPGCRRTTVVARCWPTTGRVAAAPGPPGGGRAGPRSGRRRRRHPLRRPDRAVQGAARARQGAVGLPPPLRRRGPPAPGRRHVELRVHQGAAGLRARPRPGRGGPDAGRGVGRRAGGVLRRGRRLPLALGARGVRGPAGRGDGGGRARRDARRRRGVRHGGRRRARAGRRRPLVRCGGAAPGAAPTSASGPR